MTLDNTLRSNASSQVLIAVRPPFRDDRGEILNVLDLPIGSVSRLVSAAGAVRANHYHKTDSHYCYLESGEVEYYHRPVGSTETAEHFTFGAGQLFYTPPLYEHTMVFSRDSVMWCFAKNPRFSADYEADTVRVASLTP